MGEENNRGKDFPKEFGDGEDFLEYLRKARPDLAGKFSDAQELNDILSAREAYRALRSVEKEREASVPPSAPAGILREHWAILAIFLLALFLRVLRADFGLPYLYHYDEFHFMYRAVQMLKTGDFNPHYFHYPSLVIYLQFIVVLLFFLFKVSRGAITSLDDIHYFGGWSITTPELYLWGRILTCVVGALTVVVLYMLARSLFKKKNIALASALFLAVSPGHIAQSNLVAVDVPAAFMVVLAVYLCARVLQEDSWLEYCFAATACGLAISTKYNVFPVVVPYLFAALASITVRRHAAFKTAVGVIFIALGFFVATPFALFDMNRFVNDLGYVARLYGATKFRGSPMESNWLFYARWLFSEALGLKILSILALAGVAYGLFSREWRKKAAFLVSFPLLYYCYMSVQTSAFSRNMMPVVPFLALFAAVPLGLFRPGRKSSMLRFLPAAIVVLLALYPAVTSLRDGWELHRHRDTRLVAAEWMKQNIPAGAKTAVAAELHFHLPTLSDAAFEVIPIAQRNVNLSYLRELGFEYFVAGRFKVDRLDKEPVSAFDEPFAHLEPIQKFPGNFAFLESPTQDPEIFIYKL